ncbi:MAG: CCA tRNA nucleotidyltransferase [Lachnospiraceae bacterium]
MTENKNLQMAKHIATLVSEAGGRTFYVGGYVRDKILGKENKDIDIEVHGITPKNLEKILDQVGERLEMGASFGVFGLRGYDLDIAMPRKEEATGRGHKDFAVFVDPFLGTKKAAMRRDFTMNAMMEDVLTGELVDHFGGVDDIKKGVLRHVNAKTFVEDPLRVLRAAQFAARFQFTVAKETVELSKTMDLSYLACERIYAELEKALLKAKKPSIFFEEMKKMNQLGVWFQEVEQLIGVEQSIEHHPEGDVWNHTMMVLDEAAKWKDGASNPVGFMFTAICHDFGKIVTTKEINGKIHAFGHETEGLPIVKKFLTRITNEVKLRKYVLNMVELHMRPNIMARQKSKIKSTNRLFDASLDPEGLILFSIADHMGRTGSKREEETENFLKERLAIFHEMMEKPYVMGSDLVSAGLKPSKKFHEILEYAHKLRLAGVNKENALKQTLAYARKLEKRGL